MELIQEAELKAHLMQTDEEFRQLANKHQEYSRILESLANAPHLSPEEQMEEVRLKKLKLHVKDQMSQIMNRHRAHAS